MSLAQRRFILQVKQIAKDLNMIDLACLLNDLKMLNYPASGCFFTWSNKRIKDFQCRKLDRIVVNDKWIDLLNFSKASYVKPSIQIALL